ncbi:hypothetical protein B447_17471 [Thauera sp. 27]|uniref:hypothetical protein n=1 Tax=Thauera sp. 27 TaxID=305700 RepID=UPI0002CED277|nr:hypothetical protein [Thauera sp. 27]ENO76556.1 hypothetical protein B447_17471 [Thauera sp. 27]
MSTKKNATPLRDQIIAFLSGQEEATLKQIAAATTERDFPSRVTTELNRLRTDAVVECAKKKGKNELWYWINSQPAVEQNTGSSVAGANATQPAGAAVQHNPAPVPAASLSAEPAAVDEPIETDLRQQLDVANAELAYERSARIALQEQIESTAARTLESIDPAGYLVRAPKRPLRTFSKAEAAQAAAMAAARNGSGRGEVFALVPVGKAVRGAEWREA